MALTQYPDSIVLTVITPASQDTTTGIWTAGSTSTLTYACRLEPNGTGRQMMGDDGVLRDYAYTCYLPQMTTVVPTGSTYVATTLNNGTISGTVKRPSNGQLNSRLWL